MDWNWGYLTFRQTQMWMLHDVAALPCQMCQSVEDTALQHGECLTV